MKMTNGKIWTLLIICSLVLISCSLNKPRISNDLEIAFQQLIPVMEMNTKLRITTTTGKIFKLNFDIDLVIENLSNTPVYFSMKADTPFIKIYRIKGNDWIDVPNASTYYSITGGDGYILYNNGSSHPHWFTNSVRPLIDSAVVDEGQSAIIRILVIGELMRGDKKTGIPVGAYVDVFVKP